MMTYEVKQFKNLQYVIRYPNEYITNKKFPVIIFLHGAGTRGKNIELVQKNPFFSLTDNHKEFPFITIAPQCNRDNWFDCFTTLEELVCEVINSDYAETERLYLIGASMGGYATWQLAMSMPEVFAAVVPICGGGMYWNANRLINVPVWAFHGENDPIVYLDESKKMVDKINSIGGRAYLTIYKNGNHDAWTETYSDTKVFEWLLKHKNCNIKKIDYDYDSPTLFG